MSRIKSDKINITSSIVVDFSKTLEAEEEELKPQEEVIEEPKVNPYVVEGEAILKRANEQARQIIEEAQKKAQEIEDSANQILMQAQIDSKNASDELLQNAQQEAQTLKENAAQEGAKEGYEAGYSDGLEKVKEELAQKVAQADELAKSGFEMREKILQTSQSEIVEIMCLIAKKLSLALVDKKAIFDTVQKAISLLGEKDEIILILGKNYADMLTQYLNENPADCMQNVKITLSDDIQEDLILVETPKERLDAAFSSQLDVIIEEFKSQLHAPSEAE